MKEPGYNVLKFWNATVCKHQDKTAVIFENRRWSFADMERTSNQMAAFLAKQGVQKGATVCRGVFEGAFRSAWDASPNWGVWRNV